MGCSSGSGTSTKSDSGVAGTSGATGRADAGPGAADTPVAAGGASGGMTGTDGASGGMTGTGGASGGMTGTGGVAGSGGRSDAGWDANVPLDAAPDVAAPDGVARDVAAPDGVARDVAAPDVAPRDVAPYDAGNAAPDTGNNAGVSIEGPDSFHCVNWADPRDNYVNGLLALSGLSSSSDTYATVQSKASDILSEFQTKLKANAIRIPINEPTVSGTWWNAYKAVVDTAASKGMKVIIAYWAYQNGKPDSAAAFKKMWQTVVSDYQANDLVYFDIHNEPYGYDTGWNDVAAQWLTDFPTVPKGRVIVSGTGYDDNIVPVGKDSRFAGCILQAHIYGFWHDTWTTKKQWSDSFTKELGSYSARTLVGEWGAPMTTGTDYNVDTDGDTFRAYVRAVSDIMHSSAMGSCYWPGLRNADSYSLTTLNTGASPLTLTVTNASGLDRLHWAWQM
jgi:hypothetical protein